MQWTDHVLSLKILITLLLRFWWNKLNLHCTIQWRAEKSRNYQFLIWSCWYSTHLYVISFHFLYSSRASKLKKSSGHLLATNWRNIVTRCKFFVASLYNVNDAALSMAPSIRFDCLKISRTEVGINLEVHANWLCLCDLAHFFMTKAKQEKMKCLF